MKEYPYIFYPQNALLKENLIPAKNIRTGLSESFFEKKFLNYFKNYVYKNVIIDDGKSRPYHPDYVLHIPQYNLYVDIEIDEPYSLRGKKPIHTNDDKDEIRNQYFLDKGWGIIRFAEIQIIKFPQLCCKVISEYVRNITGDHIWLEGFHEIDDLEIVEAWSSEDSISMASNSYRQKYFNFLKTIKQAKPSVSILVDGIYLNNEIRDTIRLLENNSLIESFNKSVKNSLFLKLISSYLGHFNELEEIKGKIFIELTIFISNYHSIESYSFDSEVVEIENYIINIYYIRTHDLICFSIYDKIQNEGLKRILLIADDPAYPQLLETLTNKEFILVRNYHNTHMSPYMKYISIDSVIENVLQIKYY
ncbi:MAG: hypothetical protein ACN6N7_08900 [Chryseobacterium culicis]